MTTGTKDTCLFLPLSQIFGSHKDIDTAFIGVKHTYQFTRENATNYILRANGVAAGKFTIKHISLRMPKITPSLPIAADLEQKLVSGAIRRLYFEQVRIYRNSNEQTETSVHGESQPTAVSSCLTTSSLPFNCRLSMVVRRRTQWCLTQAR